MWQLNSHHGQRLDMIPVGIPSKLLALEDWTEKLFSFLWMANHLSPSYCVHLCSLLLITSLNTNFVSVNGRCSDQLSVPCQLMVSSMEGVLLFSSPLHQVQGVIYCTYLVNTERHLLKPSKYFNNYFLLLKIKKLKILVCQLYLNRKKKNKNKGLPWWSDS